jgi:hypothetical protein
MFTGMPCRGTVSARLCMLTCCAKRPVIRLLLDGEQNLSTSSRGGSRSEDRHAVGGARRRMARTRSETSSRGGSRSEDRHAVGGARRCMARTRSESQRGSAL